VDDMEASCSSSPRPLARSGRAGSEPGVRTGPGAGPAQAVLTGAGTVMAIFFAAVSAYR
jgi:hypothetical protein